MLKSLFGWKHPSAQSNHFKPKPIIDLTQEEKNLLEAMIKKGYHKQTSLIMVSYEPNMARKILETC